MKYHKANCDYYRNPETCSCIPAEARACCQLCRENPPVPGESYCAAKGCRCHALAEVPACCEHGNEIGKCIELACHSEARQEGGGGKIGNPDFLNKAEGGAWRERFDKFLLGDFKDGLHVPRSKEEWYDFLESELKAVEERTRREVRQEAS